jgi:6-phosphogluconate dehydrogenase
VLDKVVQDMTGEEGTGVWSSMEAVRLHVAAPTLSTAHFLRIASAYRGQREIVNKAFSFPPQSLNIPDAEKAAFIEQLRVAVYTACLASFIQGTNIIDAANKENKWNIDYSAVWQIWRAGCIIQMDWLSDNVLGPVYHNAANLDDVNLLTKSEHAQHGLKSGYPKLKEVLAQCTKADMVVPALSATAEWIKIVSGTDLPTAFYEAQLDYFGNHMYDTKDDKDVGGPTEGKHHFEWKPASQK